MDPLRNVSSRNPQNQQGRTSGRGHPIPGASNRTLSSTPVAPNRHVAASNTRPVSASTRPVTLQEVFDELRRGHEERRKLKEDILKMGQDIQKVVNEFKELNEMLKSQAESSFSIESSIYKNDLIREAGLLYVKSLKRKPTTEEIGQVIMKVLQQEGRNRDKFFKAKTFVSNRLTDIRCEERRRIFGIRPCENYVNLTTTEFAERFLSTVKASTASSEVKKQYKRHLALLRKFAREEEDRNDTFKKFRDWLDGRYTQGHPQEADWEDIMREDDQYLYHNTSDNYQTEDDNHDLLPPANYD